MTSTGERPERAAPQPHAVVGVGLVVVGPDGRVLLGQAHDGRWERPGGQGDPRGGVGQAAPPGHAAVRER
ncbi:DNA mismatch repair protein MutT, partial [Streptomyces sp. NPDC059552]